MESAKGIFSTHGLLLAVAGLAIVLSAAGLAIHTLDAAALVTSKTYTLDADFDEGTSINVVHDPSDQLQLDDTTEAFNFIWIAVSTAGTAVKIDTETGVVLGEYRTAPQGRGLNPSRTTVDQNGSVWVGNRNETGFVSADAIAPGVPPVNRNMGSVVRIGLEENGQCEDRDGSTTIETSTGLGDVRNWDNAGSANTLGGVSTADDECIINYTRVNSTGTRHVSVDANNDVWVGGLGGRLFDLLDGSTPPSLTSGDIIRQEPTVGYGGYGGLIDGNGVIWSARGLLRWDVANPLTGANGDPAGTDIGPPILGRNWSGQGSPDSYGLCIDSQGNVWNTQLSGNTIAKYAPDGTHLGSFPHGDDNAQGCVVDQNDDVWVAHSLFGGKNTVGHIKNDGVYVGNVTLDGGVEARPTGVAVDGNGKVWATGFNSGKAYRIDPSAGPIGADAVTPIGAVDFTTVHLGGSLYNYSDMTGSTLTGAPDNGTWTVVFNSGAAGTEWGTVSWTSDEPGDSSITVTAASSGDGVVFGAPEAVTDSVDLTVADGQYLKVTVSFARSSGGASPILFDLTIKTAIEPADPKVTGVTVDCDDPVDTNTPFDCTVDVTVHNNGPATPVNTDVTVGLSVPPDCDDPADQIADDVSLVASVAQIVSKTFQTQCSLRSSHTFTGSGELEVDDPDVEDTNPNNNSGSGQDTNAVFDLADAKVTGVTIDCPADADADTPFTCTVETTVHNNGPTTPVDVGGAVNVGVPNDCTVENFNLFGQGYGLLSLAVSVSQTVSKDFNITCTDNGLHQIVGCAIVQVNQIHVRDQVPVANNYGVATTTTDIVDPLLLIPGRCTTVDPPEICGNGIDDDGDTLIDEEPDTDRDGVNNCNDDDDDGDGFSDAVEEYVGTAPLANCAWVVGVHPAWPPDFDDSQDVNIIDVLTLKPAFGSAAGDAGYVARADLNADGDINIVDVLALKSDFGTSCN